MIDRSARCLDVKGFIGARESRYLDEVKGLMCGSTLRAEAEMNTGIFLCVFVTKSSESRKVVVLVSCE